MKPQIGFFFSELQGPSFIINLAQLVSPNVALPAELVFPLLSDIIHPSWYPHPDSPEGEWCGGS